MLTYSTQLSKSWHRATGHAFFRILPKRSFYAGGGFSGIFSMRHFRCSWRSMP